MEDVSREEVEAFTERLEAFAGGLSSREQDLLATILDRASADIEDPEVSGYQYASQASFSVAKATSVAPLKPNIGNRYFPAPGGNPFGLPIDKVKD
jgi:hypothetical protein